jgi:hypothetical protein
MTDMRHELLTQIDTLLDLAERHAWTNDPDERKYAIGVIRHVSEVVAPYRYNGPTHSPWHAFVDFFRIIP